MIERRSLPVEVRVDAENPRRFSAVVMRYDVVDAYGTIWTPGVFARSLAERLPRVVWAHDMSDPIGRYVDYTDTAETLTLVGELDDFDAVPRALQASSQLASGTIDQFSVGFIRSEQISGRDLAPEDRDAGAVERITRAELPETSLVVVGAVPGTHVVSMRSVRTTGGTVPSDFVLDLGAKLASGAITREQAEAALSLVASTEKDDAPTTEVLDADTMIALEGLGL